jgi:hypothetical protein
MRPWDPGAPALDQWIEAHAVEVKPKMLPAPWRLPPARRGLRGPPPQAQGPRRRHQPGELHPAVLTGITITS